MGIPEGMWREWIRTLADTLESAQVVTRKYLGDGLKEIRRLVGRVQDGVEYEIESDFEWCDEQLRLRDESANGRRWALDGQRCGTGANAEAVRSDGESVPVADEGDGNVYCMGAEIDQCARGRTGQSGKVDPDGVSALQESSVQVTEL